MITALFGASCSGKTTLGRRLAADANRPFRSCGDVAKERARHLNVEINALSSAEHQRIDDETRVWCRENVSGVVEGRYLDQVLVEHLDRVDLILLVASPAERAVRWAKRTGSAIDEALVARSDQDDEAFRQRSYGQTPRLTPAYTLDTSAADLETSLQLVQARHGDE